MMIGINFRPIPKQYFIVIVANLTFFQFGVTIGWMSPAMAKLRNDNQTVLPQPLTNTETAWVMSLSSFSALFAFIYVSFIANFIGRKYSILIAVLPRIISCFLLLFSSRVWMLYLGRAFCGLSDFSVISVVTMYNSEIASKEVRGGLGTLSQISSALGSMIFLSIGPFVSYLSLNILQTASILATSIPLLFLPESPYFLYSAGRTEEAIKILTYLRGDATSASEELKDYSLSKIENTTIKHFVTDSISMKALGIVLILAIGSQLTGYTAVMFYLQIIFQSTGTTISPESSSVIIGCIQVFACICTILLTDRFGRKPVLTSTLFVLALGLLGLGTFFVILNNGGDITGFLNYLPLISIILVIFCFNAGIGALVWTVMAELFDGPSRALGVTAGTLTATFFTFLTIRYFASIADAVGPSAVYWIFASCCIVTCLFIVFLVPETKGKAFSEIQKELGRT